MRADTIRTGAELNVSEHLALHPLNVGERGEQHKGDEAGLNES